MVESDRQDQKSLNQREFAIICESLRAREGYRCQRVQPPVTRPLVKVFLDMVDTSLKFLVPSSSFCPAKLCVRRV